MIVYHGSTETVPEPDVRHSCRCLDFGKGFYVTTVKVQAERWARRKAILSGRKSMLVNEYEMRHDTGKYRVKDFGDDLYAWIDFVCSCRNGETAYQQYDIIQGKVADDQIYRVVYMYKNGIWDKARALKEIRVYETYDQIAFISQDALSELLRFQNSYRVSP